MTWTSRSSWERENLEIRRYGNRYVWDQEVLHELPYAKLTSAAPDEPFPGEKGNKVSRKPPHNGGKSLLEAQEEHRESQEHQKPSTQQPRNCPRQPHTAGGAGFSGSQAAASPVPWHQTITSFPKHASGFRQGITFILYTSGLLEKAWVSTVFNKEETGIFQWLRSSRFKLQWAMSSYRLE